MVNIYVPILKWKKGEQEALKNLTIREQSAIMPLLEITDLHEPEAFSNTLSNCFTKPVYIDTVIAAEDDRNYLFSLIEAVKKDNREAFPVLYYDDLPNCLELFSPLVNQFAIKIPIPVDIDGPDYMAIFQQVKDLHSSGLLFDIVLDLNTVNNGKEASSILREVSEVLNDYFIDENFYNKVIISVTSFPEDLSTLNAGENLTVTRYDYKIFKKIVETPNFKSLVNKLVYSDYGVTKFTDSEIDFRRIRYGPLPKLKYTTQDSYIILKGKRDRGTKKMTRSYKDLAFEVYNSNFYFGEEFSFGDREIKERALSLNNKGPGSSTNWVSIVANHHVVAVVEQLSKLI